MIQVGFGEKSSCIDSHSTHRSIGHKETSSSAVIKLTKSEVTAIIWNRNCCLVAILIEPTKLLEIEIFAKKSVFSSIEF